GLLPVFAKHLTSPENFEATGYAPLVGSGPYEVAETRAGAAIGFRRRPDWWGADLPVNRGTYNLDEIRYEYYRDATSLFEAFKAGLIDLRFESDPGRWTSGYDVPLIRRGMARREAVADPGPFGMTGFAFNTRRPMFRDIRVREALALMLDVSWINARLFAGLYRPTFSYFEGSELSAIGHPASAGERRLLAPYAAEVRPDLWDGRSPSPADGTGRDRTSARQALKLLAEAGYVRNGRAADPGTGAPLSFEILTANREQERVALVYAGSLARIGVVARIRQADPIGYERRRQSFDYDMIIASWPTSLSPGNEQSFRWSAAAADSQGSLNLPGVRSAAADAAIVALVSAATRQDLTDAARALDRVLLSGFYVAPLYHAPDLWLAYSSTLRRPASVPKLGIPIELWWRDGR
ncbi:MAG TPA: extracellular solute-binding protein, partial [Allosphingosinicella sp.]|nr:extracellular solute-binding protein [Allosphingosinicella sp.]